MEFQIGLRSLFLQYLLRVRKYRKLLWNDALAANNVYMDVFLGNTDFHRAPLNKGKESYSFYFGKNQMRLLYADCLEGRKAIATGEVQTSMVEGKYSEILRLNDDYIRAVLFQVLILDDLKVDEGLVSANLYTIFLLR